MQQPNNRLDKASFFIKHPDRLKVFIGTWNMYGRLLPIDLSTFLTKTEVLENTSTSVHLDNSVSHPYHLLVIGTQECERDISESLFYPSKEVWEKKLSEYLGVHYRLLKTETLAALHLAVFVWQPIAHLIKDVQSEHIKTGWANMVGNKGAVAVSVLVGSKSLIFINCHLRAHQTHVAERNANIQRILYELKMPRFKTQKKKKKNIDLCVLNQFDHVFLFGDTNYRLNAERSFVFQAIRNGDYKNLLEYDQLTEERRVEGSLLSAFQEYDILFPPTYKLDTIIVDSSSSLSDELKQGQKHLTEDACTLFNHTHPLSTYFSHHNVIINNKKRSPKLVRRSSTSSLPTAMATPSKLKAAGEKPVSRHKRGTSLTQIGRRLSKRYRSSVSEPTIVLCSQEEAEDIHVHQESRIVLDGLPNVTLCYDSSEKQRVPSWTDRILWYDQNASTVHKHSQKKDSIGKRLSTTTTILFPFKNRSKPMKDATLCYAYDAVLHESLMGVSDHMPVIGVFGIAFDEWNIVQQKLSRILPRKSTDTLSNMTKQSKPLKKKKKHWWRHLFH
ncbi:Endonuclease/exonuclease/phosphatase [Choanephora cucurbitarum]|nr:Endonuclease/exonuclease/phosphatase [Choanephora cucurbitarum]